MNMVFILLFILIGIKSQKLFTVHKLLFRFIDSNGVICIDNDDKNIYTIKIINKHLNKDKILTNNIKSILLSDIELYNSKNECFEYYIKNTKKSSFLYLDVKKNTYIRGYFVKFEDDKFLLSKKKAEKSWESYKKQLFHDFNEKFVIINCEISFLNLSKISEKYHIQIFNSEINFDSYDDNIEQKKYFINSVLISNSILNLTNSWNKFENRLNINQDNRETMNSIINEYMLWFTNFSKLLNIKITSSKVKINEDFTFNNFNLESDNKKRNLQYNLNPCNSINDCFNCSLYSDAINSCSWSQGRCLQSNYSKNTPNWWDYFNSCNDESSKNIMRNYCGNYLVQSIPASFTLPITDNMYGKRNLFCDYEINNFYNNNFYLEINKTFGYGLDRYSVVTFQNGNYISLKNIDTSIILNSTRVYFKYLCSSQKSIPPFSFGAFYVSSSSSSFATLFISIGVIVSICIVCSICFYKCSKMIIEKANKKLQQNREFNMMNQNQIIPGLLMNPTLELTPAQREAQLREENKRILKEKLKEEFKPLKYNKDMNEYLTNCTICLEGFAEDTKVSLLPCKHLFHFNCWKDWLFKNVMDPKCPNCNYHVFDIKINEKGLININTIQVQSHHNQNDLLNEQAPSREVEVMRLGANTNNQFDGTNSNNQLNLNMNHNSQGDAEQLNTMNSQNRQRIVRNNFV